MPCRLCRSTAGAVWHRSTLTMLKLSNQNAHSIDDGQSRPARNFAVGQAVHGVNAKQNQNNYGDNIMKNEHAGHLGLSLSCIVEKCGDMYIYLVRCFMIIYAFTSSYAIFCVICSMISQCILCQCYLF